LTATLTRVIPVPQPPEGATRRQPVALLSIPAPQSYREDFDAFMREDRSPEWLRELREDAFARFELLGFPTQRNEDWHFTSVAPIAERGFRLPAPTDSGEARPLYKFVFGDDWLTLVFVNGRFLRSNGIDLPDGIEVSRLSEAIQAGDPRLMTELGRIATYDRNAFTALNAAFFSDGAFIRVGANADIPVPIHLVFVSDSDAGTVCHPRNFIVAGRSSRATIVESYVAAIGATDYFTNAVTEVVTEEGAHLAHYKLQMESHSAFHVGTIQAQQDKASRYDSFSFATGAALSRTNVQTVLAGDGAETVMNGLYLVDGIQHVDHQTFVEHIAPNCPSHELYKGILDGRSHGVFNGKVYVHPEAQKTDGKQSNNNLLLSPEARVDTKPQLEIFADDVKCTHGATVGRIDETALFYLRSRGINRSNARKLLTYAFAADVLERLDLTELRDALESQVLERFTGS
jgi:Fe-S cluster assembly protein SufD